jgi:flagellar hook protein FlgE
LFSTSTGGLTSGATVSFNHSDLEFLNGSTIATGQIKIDFTNTTQYGSASAIQVLKQDGYAAGNLSGVGIDQEGNLVASYTNGLRKKMARMALADFACLNGLAREGNTLYQGTTTSGDALMNKPGVGGMGTIVSSMLEESNVDLASEFIRMILIQRGYQANTKVITTADEMLAQLINIR